MTVSVAVTCYNYGRFVGDCLESVLAQTYQDIEIIVIDDGSTDNSREAIAPFLSDSRVQYHYITNRGQAAAKNAAVARASGDIVAFIDADDTWLPTKLARQLPLFDDPAVGVAFTDHSVIDAEGNAIYLPTRTGYMTFRTGNVTRWLGYENFVPFSSSAVRRLLLIDCGGFDESLGMGIDWDLWLRLSLKCRFAGVSERLMAYRMGHTNQMSKNLPGRLAASEHIFGRFLEQHPDVFSVAALREINFYNCCSRGNGYRQSDLSRSTRQFTRALRSRPWSPAPYVGLSRNAIVVLRRILGYRS